MNRRKAWLLLRNRQTPLKAQHRNSGDRPKSDIRKGIEVRLRSSG